MDADRRSDYSLSRAGGVDARARPPCSSSLPPVCSATRLTTRKPVPSVTRRCAGWASTGLLGTSWSTNACCAY